MNKYISKTLLIISTFLTTLFLYSSTVFAAGGGSGGGSGTDVTKEVAHEKTVYRWFYWPGWAFGGLVLLVVALMGFIYWKNVIAPKKRSHNIS
jgi:protein-S-isoprenylcysteine O-methyltransferase Ste14